MLSGSSAAEGTEESPTSTGITGIFRSRAASISIRTKSLDQRAGGFRYSR